LWETPGQEWNGRFRDDIRDSFAMNPVRLRQMRPVVGRAREITDTRSASRTERTFV